MTLWVTLTILTILTSAATVLLLAPLWSRLVREAGAASAGDIASDLDRLSDIEKRLAAGLLDAGQAEAERATIRRRILGADRAAAPVLARFAPGARKLAVVAVAGIALASLGLYAFDDVLNDGPTPPAAPAQSEKPQGTAAVEALAAAMASGAAFPPPVVRPQDQAQPGLGSADEMIDRLAERLGRNPKDVEGWRLLGWSYFNTGRFAQSATAYAKAVALSPGGAELRSAYGEALVKAADGRVTADARAEFAQALRLDRKDARARFFAGLVKAQDGDKMSALDDWIAILNEADSHEPWFADLVQRVTELGRETGIDVSARMRRNESVATGGVPILAPAR